MQIWTADNQSRQVGDRVYNYYDCKWGVIVEEPDNEGWFDVKHDDGTTKCLNGERICSYKPN